MPFVYELRLRGDTPELRFVQQLVPAGSLVGTGQAVATLTDGAREFHLTAPRQGLLVAWFAEHGTEVEGGDVVARVVCEGDAVEVEDVSPQRLGAL